MAAVVRVKRRLDEEPLNALVLNCKRRKTEVEVEHKTTELSAVLKFAGTVSEAENVLSHIRKQVNIAELKDQFKKHPVNISDKLRIQKQQDSKDSRYKVVNCFRSDGLDENSEETHPEYTVFEIETDVNENDGNAINKNSQAAQHSSSEPKYVYDLYYTNSDDFGDATLDDCISVHPLSENLMFGSMRDNGVKDKDSDDDSEDSNAENNWRNDYPDESDIESVNEEDMVAAMKKTTIEDDVLSSDDGEEGFVYSIDSEAAGFEEDVDESDVRRYGEMYARFKARSKKVVESTDVNFYYGDIDEDEYYY